MNGPVKSALEVLQQVRCTLAAFSWPLHVRCGHGVIAHVCSPFHECFKSEVHASSKMRSGMTAHVCSPFQECFKSEVHASSRSKNDDQDTRWLELFADLAERVME
jgi:hypothetical protein